MRPDAVLFDLDGTLVDSMTAVPTAYARAVHARGGPKVSAADVVAAWHIGPSPVVLAHFLGRPATPADVECFHRLLDAEAAAVRPFPGIVDLLGALRGNGRGIGVVTSATRRGATRMLARARLAGYFPVVVCGDEVPAPKPAPDGLLLACGRLGVAPARTAYVGDADVDLRCAAAAGAAPVLARWGGPATVPGAGVVVADRPADVARLLGCADGKLPPVRNPGAGPVHL